KEKVLVALKSHPDSPLAQIEDKETLAASPVLAEYVLRMLRKTKDTAVPLTRVQKKLHADLQGPFVRAVEEGCLPASIGWIWAGGKKRLLLREDVHTGRASPTAGHDPSRSFGVDVFVAEFREAFARLDRQSGDNNFVRLADLRKELSSLDQATFDSQVRGLQQ